MARDLNGAVVVITGTSSGIGRAAARRFAAEGAKVVLAARREEPLLDLQRELGDAALAVPTDITDEAAVHELARRAAERFGGIDVWINNAAVTAFGRLEEMPSEAFRRVIETNLLGYVHGARAALPQLRARRGVLVNVASVNGRVPAPYVSAYVASKHAVLGWAGSLRQELDLEGAGVRVCSVLPASIDTPLFQHAANWTGRRAKALDPVNDPDRVATALVRAVRWPVTTLPTGRGALQMLAMRTAGGRLFERVFARVVDRNHFLDEPQDPTEGNLFAPVLQGTDARGGWQERARRERPAPVAAATTDR